MPDIAGVRTSPMGRIQYYDASGMTLAVGDRVLVETEDGDREGVVAIAPHQVLHSDLRGPLDPVLRKLDDQ